MNNQVLHTAWCSISAKAAGEILNWSLLGVKRAVFPPFWIRVQQASAISPWRLWKRFFRVTRGFFFFGRLSCWGAHWQTSLRGVRRSGAGQLQGLLLVLERQARRHQTSERGAVTVCQSGSCCALMSRPVAPVQYSAVLRSLNSWPKVSFYPASRPIFSPQSGPQSLSRLPKYKSSSCRVWVVEFELPSLSWVVELSVFPAPLRPALPCPVLCFYLLCLALPG